MRTKPWIIAVAVLGWIWVASCAHRTGAGIDVDAIQGVVDAIQGDLDRMQAALENKDLPGARARYLAARRLFDERRAQLVAYPEVGEVERVIGEAEKTLCLEHVNIPLGSYFQSIRDKNARAARRQLQAARRAFGRCEEILRDSDAFIALKMNLDTAPDELEKLEREIESVALKDRVQAAGRRVAARLQDIRREIDQLRAQPDRKELARTIAGHLDLVRTKIHEQPDLADNPAWRRLSAKMLASVEKLEAERAALVRRGKLLWTVDHVLRPAVEVAFEAVSEDDNPDALEAFRRARRGFSACEDAVASLVAEEPGLWRYAFTFDNRTRSVGWLYAHCAFSRRIAAALDRILLVVDQDVPAASRAAEQALEVRAGPGAARLFQQAYAHYHQCERILSDILQWEPRLQWFPFRLEDDEWVAGWLRQRCAAGRRAAAHKVRELTGKQPLPATFDPDPPWRTDRHPELAGGPLQKNDKPEAARPGRAKPRPAKRKRPPRRKKRKKPKTDRKRKRRGIQRW